MNQDLRARTKQFALRIIRMFVALPTAFRFQVSAFQNFSLSAFAF
jgi:hypothetical protein